MSDYNHISRAFPAGRPDPEPLHLYTVDTGPKQAAPPPCFLTREEAEHAQGNQAGEVLPYFAWYHRRNLLPVVIFEAESDAADDLQTNWKKILPEKRIERGFFPLPVPKNCKCDMCRVVRAWYMRHYREARKRGGQARRERNAYFKAQADKGAA